jgi:hypothetical protein
MSSIIDSKLIFTETLPVKTRDPTPTQNSIFTTTQDPIFTTTQDPIFTLTQDPKSIPTQNPKVNPPPVSQVTIINVTLFPTTTQLSPLPQVKDNNNNTGLILGIVFGILFLFLALFLLLFFIKKKRKKIDTLPAFLEPRPEPINENIPSSITILQDPNVSYTINDGLGYNIAYNSMGEPMYATNQFN